MRCLLNPLALLLTLPLLIGCARGEVMTGVDLVGEELGGAPDPGGRGGFDDAARSEGAGAAPVFFEPPAPLVATRGEVDRVGIPGGAFVPLSVQEGEEVVEVGACELDRRQVTRGEFLEFIRANPRWQRSEIRPIFADAGYLADWPGDLDV